MMAATKLLSLLVYPLSLGLLLLLISVLTGIFGKRSELVDGFPRLAGDVSALDRIWL